VPLRPIDTTRTKPNPGKARCSRCGGVCGGQEAGTDMDHPRRWDYDGKPYCPNCAYELGVLEQV